MAVPTPRTYVAAEFETATILNGDIRDTATFLLGPPHCYAYRATDVSIPTSGVWALASLTGELYDSTTTMHSTASNQSRIIAAETGLYTIKAHARFAANATGARGINIRKNAAGDQTLGTDLFFTFSLPSSGNIGYVFGSVDVQLNATDYVEMFVNQSSGGALNLLGGVTESFMSARWVSKL
ncbi:MAG TPA: hypothetical protein VGJ86_07870 [Acidimicrobiales bacterium]|jgi:hypothetical protein